MKIKIITRERRRKGKELKGTSRALAWSGYQPLTEMHTTNRFMEKEVQFCPDQV